MSLPIALGVRMRAKQMSKGKMKDAEPMASGGEVEKPESQAMSVFDHKDLAKAVIDKMSGREAPQDDFLSSDADTEMHTEAMPDDSEERMEEMSSKGMLKGIMAKRRK